MELHDRIWSRMLTGGARCRRGERHCITTLLAAGAAPEYPAGRHGCPKLTLHASDAYLGAPGFGVHRVTQFAQEACDGLFVGGWWPENFSLPMGFGYVLGWARPVTIEEVADIAAR
jgi:hypothetical protein